MSCGCGGGKGAAPAGLPPQFSLPPIIGLRMGIIQAMGRPLTPDDMDLLQDIEEFVLEGMTDEQMRILRGESKLQTSQQQTSEATAPLQQPDETVDPAAVGRMLELVKHPRRVAKMLELGSVAAAVIARWLETGVTSGPIPDSMLLER